MMLIKVHTYIYKADDHFYTQQLKIFKNSRDGHNTKV